MSRSEPELETDNVQNSASHDDSRPTSSHSYHLRSRPEVTQNKVTRKRIFQPRTFDKGLVFVKDTDILLSGDKYTIVVNIALDDYDALVHIMRYTLSQVRQKIGIHRTPKARSCLFDIHWDEIDRLDTTVQGLDDDLQSFRKLLFEDEVSRIPTRVNARAK